MTHNPVGRWLTKYLLFALTLFFIFTPLAIAQPAYDVPNPEQGDFTVHKPVVELPYSMRSNCYAFAEYYLGIDLPPMATLQKTATKALGSVAVFDYHGIPHVAVVVDTESYGHFTIKESNYKAGQITQREISFSDPALLGFITP